MADGKPTELTDRTQPTDREMLLTEAGNIQHGSVFTLAREPFCRYANHVRQYHSADHRVDESKRKLIMLAGDAACSLAVRGAVHVVRQLLEGLGVLR